MEETKKIQKYRGGRKPIVFEVTPEVIQKVELLAGLGLTHEQIFGYYGLKKDTWYKFVKRYPELDIACKRGKAKMISKVAGKLMQAIEAGKLVAIIFYLKTQGRWAEHTNMQVTNPTDVPQPTAAIQINVTDPQEAAKIYQQIMQDT